MRYQASGTVDEARVAADAASDGCFPLITNDRDADGHLALTDAQVLHAYRQQPNLERRNHLLKSMQHVAPVWLRTPHRVEALLCCHFLALMIGALLERQARHATAGTDLDAIAAYPEHRACTAPSADRIFEIFADLASHDLHDTGGTLVQTFDPQLTAIQRRASQFPPPPSIRSAPHTPGSPSRLRFQALRRFHGLYPDFERLGTPFARPRADE